MKAEPPPAEKQAVSLKTEWVILSREGKRDQIGIAVATLYPYLALNGTECPGGAQRNTMEERSGREPTLLNLYLGKRGAVKVPDPGKSRYRATR